MAIHVNERMRKYRAKKKFVRTVQECRRFFSAWELEVILNKTVTPARVTLPGNAEPRYTLDLVDHQDTLAL